MCKMIGHNFIGLLIENLEFRAKTTALLKGCKKAKNENPYPPADTQA